MKYLVSGRNDVFGYASGEIFEMELDPVTEVRLVMGGHIERVVTAAAANTPTKRPVGNDDNELLEDDGA